MQIIDDFNTNLIQSVQMKRRWPMVINQHYDNSTTALLLVVK